MWPAQQSRHTECESVVLEGQALGFAHPPAILGTCPCQPLPQRAAVERAEPEARAQLPLSRRAGGQKATQGRGGVREHALWAPGSARRLRARDSWYCKKGSSDRVALG